MSIVAEVTGRINRPPAAVLMDPAAVDDRVEAAAADLAERHGGRPSSFAVGGYRTEYRQLYALYLATLAELDRRSDEFWPDEVPSLDESAYYERDDIADAELVAALADDSTDLDLAVYQDGPSGPASTGS